MVLVKVGAASSSSQKAQRGFLHSIVLTVTHPIWQDRVRCIDAVIDSFPENYSDLTIEPAKRIQGQDFQRDWFQF